MLPFFMVFAAIAAVFAVLECSGDGNEGQTEL